MKRKVNILSIEAWRYDEDWTWNTAIYVERDVEIDADILNDNHRLLEHMIESRNALTSDARNGRVVIEEIGDSMLEFQDADNDFEPLIAIELLD